MKKTFDNIREIKGYLINHFNLNGIPAKELYAEGDLFRIGIGVKVAEGIFFDTQYSFRCRYITEKLRFKLYDASSYNNKFKTITASFKDGSVTLDLDKITQYIKDNFKYSHDTARSQHRSNMIYNLMTEISNDEKAKIDALSLPNYGDGIKRKSYYSSSKEDQIEITSGYTKSYHDVGVYAKNFKEPITKEGVRKLMTFFYSIINNQIICNSLDKALAIAKFLSMDDVECFLKIDKENSHRTNARRLKEWMHSEIKSDVVSALLGGN